MLDSLECHYCRCCTKSSKDTKSPEATSETSSSYKVPSAQSRCQTGNRQKTVTTNKSKLLSPISTTRKVNGNFINKKYKKRQSTFFPERRHTLQENNLFCSKYGC